MSPEEQRKAEIRAEALARRRSVVDRRSKQAALDRHLLAGELPGLEPLGAYAATRDEASVDALLEERWERGLATVLPRVRGPRLELWKVESRAELEPGAFGILEPFRSLERVQLADLRAIVVPGVAFDGRGQRIGYGKGHYDRLLSGIPERIARIGVAFACQLFDEIPREPHDVAMTHLLTEDGWTPVSGEAFP